MGKDKYIMSVYYIRIYYNTNSRGLGNFSWISLLDFLAFREL
jgi:hypothetical protein